jgi:hypothetical protein
MKFNYDTTWALLNKLYASHKINADTRRHLFFHPSLVKHHLIEWEEKGFITAEESGLVLLELVEL